MVTPSRSYYRRFVRLWHPGINPTDEHCTFTVEQGSREPRITAPNHVTVGEEWLARECVPPSALGDEP